MLNLDTHVLLFAVTGALRPRELRVLRAGQWSISAIVLWEIAKLAQLGRITVDLEPTRSSPPPAWCTTFRSSPEMSPS